ncbi:hypothetical protein SOVF_080730 [Spinacia oleracea]|nr:hypothetical protein SOVF_080730 [Spinacia oleracea]
MAKGVGQMAKAAVGDAIMSFGWMFTAPTLGVATSIAATAFGVEKESHLIHAIFAAVIMVHIVFCDSMAVVLGGASFNPTANAAMYTAGIGEDTLLSMALRFPAQVIYLQTF